MVPKTQSGIVSGTRDLKWAVYGLFGGPLVALGARSLKYWALGTSGLYS